MRINKIIKLIIFLCLTNNVFSQNYFKTELQNKVLNELSKNDSSSSYLSTGIYSEIWLNSQDINDGNVEGYYKRAVSKYEKGFFEEALIDIEESIKIDSSIGASFGLRALCNLQRNQHLKLILKDVDKAIQLDQGNAMFYNLRGYIKLLQNNLIDAKKDIVHSLDLKEDLPESYFYLGIINFSRGKYFRAKKYFTTTISLNGDFYDAYTHSALCDFYAGKTIQAINALDELIAVNPKFVNAYIVKADILHYDGREKESVDLYEKILELEPNNFNVNIKKAIIYFSKKEYEECYTGFKNAFYENIENQNSYLINTKKGILSSKHLTFNHFNIEGEIGIDQINDFKKAICLYLFDYHYDSYIILEDLVSKNVNVFEIHFLKGIIHEMYNENKKAIESYESALELDSENGLLYIKLGIVQSEEKLYGKAAKNLSTAIKYDQFNEKIYYHLADINNKLGNYRAAINYLNKVVELIPENKNIILERAKVKAKSGDITEALKDYDILIELYPSKSDLYCTCAELCMSIKDYESSIAYLEKRLSLNSKSYETYFLIGNFYFRQGKYEQAIEFYKKAKFKEHFLPKGYFEFYIAQSYQEIGDNDNAISYYKRVLRNYKSASGNYMGYGSDVMNELIVKSLINKGKCYKKNNDLKKMEKYYYKAFEYLPDNYLFLIDKADCFEVIQEYSYSIDCLEKYVKKIDIYPDVYFRLGLLYKKNSQIEEALGAINKAIIIDSTQYILYEEYGRIKYECGEYSEAIKYSKRAFDINPNAIKSRINMAIFELALGNDSTALSIFEETRNAINDQLRDEIISDLNVLSEKNINNETVCKIKELILSDSKELI